jgi:hypothetical protein
MQLFLQTHADWKFILHSSPARVVYSLVPHLSPSVIDNGSACAGSRLSLTFQSSPDIQRGLQDDTFNDIILLHADRSGRAV